MKPLQIAIADDHSIVREGLVQVLNTHPGITVVGEASSGKEAIKIAGDLELDCLVLDIDLQDRNGIEVIKAIRRNNQKLPILVLSMHPPSQYAARILSAGALGYITKNEPTQELVLAIRRVASGAKYISPIVAEILAERFGDDQTGVDPHQCLSDREHQFMMMVATGLTVNAIADKLSLSPKTVSMYRTRTLKKMGMKTNAELVHYAIKNNLLA
ncbi:response regulator [Polynucleobacter sp. AP-Feld-500C-C5]|uniref:response regulator n=1 Tax=Polynucleobacter sp. AP-Feld-500C-C5 TaxID=2576924 RepID=UPI00351D26C1